MDENILINNKSKQRKVFYSLMGVTFNPEHGKNREEILAELVQAEKVSKLKLYYPER